MVHHESDIAVCQQILSRDPLDSGAHYRLGKAWLDAGRREEALACFQQAATLQPDYAEAWYHLGLIHSLSGRFAQAIACGRRALEINPRYAEACNNLGYVYLVQGKLEEATACFRRAVEAKPDYVNAHYNLGLSLLRRGQVEAAVPALQAALQLRPDFAEALLQLGLAWLSLDRPQEAAASLRQASALRPDEPEIYYNLGYAYSRVGESEQALTCYQRALALNPDFLEVHYNLGTHYVELGRYDEAIAALEGVLRLRPDHVDALINIGTAYLKLRRIDESISYYQRALMLTPDNVNVLYNLGTAFIQQGRLVESAALLQRAVAGRPDYVDAHYNLGNVYNELRRFDEARACYERALAIQPDFVRALVNLGNVLLSQGRPEQAIACYDQALSIQPDKSLAHHARLLALNYLFPPAVEELWAAHRRFGAQFEAGIGPRPRHANTRDPERRLKVAYVSPDFRLHSVAFFMEPILAHHDRRAVEVYCYYNHSWQDAVSERLRRSVDHWVPCMDLGDDELAARIRSDGIDILVDLAGHTAGNRLLVLARKPAPVQVSYLGYPATTGLSALDYRLVTADTDPAGAERWHTEQLYRLPRSLWCYRPAPDLPAVAAETPARGNGFITFGSMNNIAKVSEATVATWCELLKRVPGATLVMTNVPEGEACALIAQRFAARGIGADRVQLRGNLPQSAYYEQLKGIDIALDPYPYTGTTTTCQSLWLGVPVVTLIGETSVARSGYALLKLIGLPELAAADETAYVAIAAALATHLDRLEALRQGLRARMEASPLRDEAGLTRDLEAAYRAMWRAWCAGGTQE